MPAGKIRIIGISFAAALLLAAFTGCPKPLDRSRLDSGTAMGQKELSESGNESESETSDTVGEDPDVTAAGELLDEAGEFEHDQVDTVADGSLGSSPDENPESVDEETKTSDEIEDSSAQEEESDENLPAEIPKPQPEPKAAPAHTAGAVDTELAGQWRVFYAAESDSAGLIAADDLWQIMLSPDGNCNMQTRIGGESWEQYGTWSAEAGSLKLVLGPGGTMEYSTLRPHNSIMLATSANTDETLFWLRSDGNAPSAAGEYSSDFGPLTLRVNPAGTYTGSYGDSDGTIELAEYGAFLGGEWELEGTTGYVIFEVLQGKLNGRWWYPGDAAFSGTWNAAKQ